MSRVMDRVMDIATPLGEGVLLFHGMRGREELGRLSEYHLDLLSNDGEVDVDAILGKNVTVKLALPDDSTRYFNGYVTRFSQGEEHGRYFRYRATVHPWLWFLTRTSDCRIFQEMTVPDIIKKVFADHGTADFTLELTSTYRKWTYCVQYRETDFNFVSRLMEQEGIYYYFRHTDGHNTLVLTDSSSKHVPSPGYEEITYVSPGRLVRPELEHISRWHFSREIQPGVYAHKDYDLERPSVDLKTQKILARNYTPSDYEVFDYPGEYLQKPDGEQYASVRIDELGTRFETANGVTNARGISVGALFTLDACPRGDQNREYLVIDANYDLEFSNYEALEGSGTSYQCSFSAISTKQQFRPRRTTPKPFVQGPQTAMVVGPAGDEIHTDEFGRVKVQFHWDRLGKNDENSSCWVRVSHPWAGKGWGLVSTPRIGQEVVVDFLEGDPDQPIITGRVYNAESQPPFGFPAGAVISGLKSQTHKGAGYNEMSFDDTAGTEKITIHGQFDMNTTVEHDQASTVHNNRTDRVDVDDAESVGNNQTCSVGVNQDTTVGANQSLNVGADQSVTVGANRTKSVGANETNTIAGNRASTVTGSDTTTITGGSTTTITGGSTTTVSGGAASTVNGASDNTVNGHMTEMVTAGEDQIITGAKTLTVSGPFTESVTGMRTMAVTGAIAQSATAAIDITAMGPGTYTSPASLTFAVGGSVVAITPGSITITAGGSTVTVDGGGVSLNGAKISLNG